MALHDLKNLVDDLQSVRDRAQQRLDRRQERLLEQLIEIGRDGEPTSLCWVSRLPSGDGRHRTHELVRLPWASLRSASPGYAAKVSVCFDCQVAPAAPSESEAGDLKLAPVTGRKGDSDARHRLQINLSPEEEGSAEIRLDDRRLKPAGSDRIQIPPEIMEVLLAEQRRPSRFPVGKLLAALVLIGLVAAAVLWFMGILPQP